MSDSIKKYFENENKKDYNDWLEHQWTKNTTLGLNSRDGIVQDVKDLYEERSQIGIKKYGTTLEDSRESLEAFLVHLQEELMDATLYIEKTKTIKW